MAVGPLAIFLSLYSVFLLFKLASGKKAPPNWNRRLETKDALLVFGNAAILSTVCFGWLLMFGIWNVESVALGRLVTFSAVSGSVFALLIELMIAAILNLSPPVWGAAKFVARDLDIGKRFSRGILALGIILSLTWAPFQFLTISLPATPKGNASIANAFELLFGKYPLGIAWALSFALSSLVLLWIYALVLAVFPPRFPSSEKKN
jgi:hypothetical protein